MIYLARPFSKFKIERREHSVTVPFIDGQEVSRDVVKYVEMVNYIIDQIEKKEKRKMIKKEKMLSCPFCGAFPTIEPWHGGKPTKRLISCENDECSVQPSVAAETEQEAIENWNKRA